MQQACLRHHEAVLAQSVERKTLNLVVVGSSPTVGYLFLSALPFSHVVYNIQHCLWGLVVGHMWFYVDNL